MKYHIFELRRKIWRHDWSSQLCTQLQLWNYCKAWKKFRPERDLNQDLCYTNAVLYQLSYEDNWELITSHRAGHSPLTSSLSFSNEAYMYGNKSNHCNSMMICKWVARNASIYPTLTSIDFNRYSNLAGYKLSYLPVLESIIKCNHNTANEIWTKKTFNSRKGQRTNQKHRELVWSDQQTQRCEETELRKAEHTVGVNNRTVSLFKFSFFKDICT